VRIGTEGPRRARGNDGRVLRGRIHADILPRPARRRCRDSGVKRWNRKR
jgi:hypothetical protein